jgi:hypothetical protein
MFFALHVIVVIRLSGVPIAVTIDARGRTTASALEDGGARARVADAVRTNVDVPERLGGPPGGRLASPTPSRQK